MTGAEAKFKIDFINKLLNKMKEDYDGDRIHDLSYILVEYAKEINNKRKEKQSNTSYVDYSNKDSFIYQACDSYGEEYDVLNFGKIKNYLTTLTIEELSIIGNDFGFHAPKFLEVVKDVIRIDIERNIKSQFQDAIKNVKENPDNAIEEARSATIKFIKKYLNDETIDKDNLKEKIRQFLKDKKILPENMANGNPEIRNICSHLISIGNDIEIIRKTITDAHVEGCIKDENLAVFIINCLASVCYFFDNIESNINQEKIEEKNITNNQDEDDDIPF